MCKLLRANGSASGAGGSRVLLNFTDTRHDSMTKSAFVDCQVSCSFIGECALTPSIVAIFPGVIERGRKPPRR